MRKCQYCVKPAVATILWFRGPFGRPGPAYVPYCGSCSIKDAHANRGMTAPVAEGTDYEVVALPKDRTWTGDVIGCMGAACVIAPLMLASVAVCALLWRLIRWGFTV